MSTGLMRLCGTYRAPCHPDRLSATREGGSSQARRHQIGPGVTPKRLCGTATVLTHVDVGDRHRDG